MTHLILVTTMLMGAPADARKTILARYKAYEQATAKNDARAMDRWIAQTTTSDFTYTSRDKQTFRKAAFQQGMREQSAMTKHVEKATLRVTGIKVQGNTATALTVADMAARVSIQGQMLRLTDKSTTVDTWVRIGNEWKFRRSVQTKADTQIYQGK